MANNFAQNRVFLQEYLDTKFEKELIQEDVEQGRARTYRMRGVFQRGDEVNGNRRKYPLRLLEREVERLQEAVRSKRVVGELDHPPGREKAELKSASHVITKLEVRGTDVWGEIEIIPGTDAGRNLLGLVDAGIGIGVSSRGTGGLKPLPGNIFEVDENLQINTWDVVGEPSVRDAYLREGLDTNLQFVRDTKSMLYYMEKTIY